MRGPVPWERGSATGTGTRIQGARRRHDHCGNPERETTGEFLLDANPQHAAPGCNGRNVIDAPWIDVRTGLFVDVTGVKERGEGDLRSDKNGHGYAARQLWPLRDTVFEGVPASVPFDFAEMPRGECGVESLYLRSIRSKLLSFVFVFAYLPAILLECLPICLSGAFDSRGDGGVWSVTRIRTMADASVHVCLSSHSHELGAAPYGVD
ncbi:hypothetical protein DL769_002212 [Monosporascus sp. CRB-8-3]|nr:hypothetical protein DL769_002212 [Monosporascus sp. CRB-8-3]